MAMEPHTKIINAVAKKTLAPYGFFRLGRSRVWLQDNGYFLTVVEFQPSGFSKGTYLNVAMHFLWGPPLLREEPYISFDYGDRVLSPFIPSQFIDYTGDDELFASQVESLAQTANTIAGQYARCVDLKHAVTWLCPRLGNPTWQAYLRAMLCFLAEEFVAGRKYMEEFAERCCGDKWYHDRGLDAQWAQQILQRCDSPESARQMVLDQIRTYRTACLAKSSYKGMSREVYNG